MAKTTASIRDATAGLSLPSHPGANRILCMDAHDLLLRNTQHWVVLGTICDPISVHMALKIAISAVDPYDLEPTRAFVDIILTRQTGPRSVGPRELL